MQQWQLQLLGQFAERVDLYRESQLSLAKLVEDARGLFDAADISDNDVRGSFEAAWAPVSGEVDLRVGGWGREEWLPQERLDAAVAGLREWAVGISRWDLDAS